ncbi:TetR/AcrR family transcriptional regulator [Rhodococcus sp. LB1]|uniref:TetR/AcrR family transcriptional regulator n=1 Tax=Rhodococcus sp. LB1 TaxID=1807499 RepID=UPI00077A8CDA|nr:TetR/AcrR family transcriptional regulator [Rhodococcus sp. LB1]KXX58794.1 hypothetical protein AZG88_08025 [Rhodococcus sp. LB1]
MDAHTAEPQITPNRRIPKQQRSQLKVAQILDSASELLKRVPIDDVSVKLIAQHAGVAVPTFYGYFSDREAVFNALGMHYLDETLELIDQLASLTFDTWEDASDAMVDTYVEWFRSRVGFRVLWFSGRLDEAVVAADRAGNAALADRVRLIMEQTVGHDLETPSYVFHFTVEMTDRLLRYGFELSPDGDEQTFVEIKRALRSYLSNFLPASTKHS